VDAVALRIDQIHFFKNGDEIAFLQREVGGVAVGRLPESCALADHRVDQARPRPHPEMRRRSSSRRLGAEAGVIIRDTRIEIMKVFKSEEVVSVS
jgi:hypothetical protein